jgi:hypothetical protein
MTYPTTIKALAIFARQWAGQQRHGTYLEPVEDILAAKRLRTFFPLKRAATVEHISARLASALHCGRPACGRVIDVDEKAKGGYHRARRLGLIKTQGVTYSMTEGIGFTP